MYCIYNTPSTRHLKTTTLALLFKKPWGQCAYRIPRPNQRDMAFSINLFELDTLQQSNGVNLRDW